MEERRVLPAIPKIIELLQAYQISFFQGEKAQNYNNHLWGFPCVDQQTRNRELKVQSTLAGRKVIKTSRFDKNFLDTLERPNR